MKPINKNNRPSSSSSNGSNFSEGSDIGSQVSSRESSVDKKTSLTKLEMFPEAATEGEVYKTTTKVYFTLPNQVQGNTKKIKPETPQDNKTVKTVTKEFKEDSKANKEVQAPRKKLEHLFEEIELTDFNPKKGDSKISTTMAPKIGVIQSATSIENKKEELKLSSPKIKSNYQNFLLEKKNEIHTLINADLKSTDQEAYKKLKDTVLTHCYQLNLCLLDTIILLSGNKVPFKFTLDIFNEYAKKLGIDLEQSRQNTDETNTIKLSPYPYSLELVKADKGHDAKFRSAFLSYEGNKDQIDQLGLLSLFLSYPFKNKEESLLVISEAIEKFATPSKLLTESIMQSKTQLQQSISKNKEETQGLSASGMKEFVAASLNLLADSEVKYTLAILAQKLRMEAK